MSNIETTRAWLEGAWNQHNLDVLVSIFAPNFVNHDPTGEFVGINAQKAFISAFITAMPDVRVQINQIAAEGDDVVCDMTFTGTQTGPLVTAQGTIPPTGNRTSVDVKGRDHYQNGKVVESWAEWDPNDLMRQLGVG